MGMFSWKTADTKESIWNTESGMPIKKVYLLQPDEDPIEETGYKGYGYFGCTDAYEWLAIRNIEKELLLRLSAKGVELRNLGIEIDLGSYYVDKRDGKKFIYGYGEMLTELGLSGFVDDKGNCGNYGSVYTGETINDLIANGVWKKIASSKLFCEDGVVRFPLKFSHNKEARYEDLNASESCPYQGFFYGDENDC